MNSNQSKSDLEVLLERRIASRRYYLALAYEKMKLRRHHDAECHSEIVETLQFQIESIQNELRL